MFGATAVRRKREKERRERVARNSANIIYPYIKPYGNKKLQPIFMFYKIDTHSSITEQKCKIQMIFSGPRFDKYQLPYFKHRQHLFLDFSETQVAF